ncbi:anti-sigma-I factor RsgI family protein [Lacrimispora xylanisolvens]|uniref:anti-sigma-I factor RsgI family protein n=1 Tax=Lacrimispora xylanisolvens TaxID=384636 RepID=UPI0024028356
MALDKHKQLNRKQIEACLKSATDDLIPNVLDRIDLSTPQIEETSVSKPVFFKRQRVIAGLIAACFCMIMLAGGTYSYQNSRVDSVIGIDVNPSVELSVNKKNRVLKAEAVNQDGMTILKDMDMEGVDLNVAVNAIIGSMVTHGFLDDLDNAILVTVSNDSIKKASNLRSAVVTDIRTTLEED